MIIRGVIHKGVGGLYNVRLISGQNLECKVRGRLKLNDSSIVVGDRVEVDTKECTIENILDRENIFLRPVVANIEKALIVFSALNPSISYNLLDKILITCEHEFVEPIICINKLDLADVDLTRYDRSGYKIFRVSVKNQLGLKELIDYISGSTVVLTGPSGVGKSSLLKLITGYEAVTGEVSVVANRGKHTTRHTEFYDIPEPNGGILVDSPGFGAVNLSYIGRENIRHMFPEFRVCEACKFNDCLHLDEPGCSVKNAVENKEFSIERYNSYKKIMEEI